MSHFIVTGPRGGMTQGADAPNRLDINDLVNIEDQFSLYVQAIGELDTIRYLLLTPAHARCRAHVR